MNSVFLKLRRIPRTALMLANVEWGQYCTRSFKEYILLRYKSIRAHFNRNYPQALQIEPYGGCNIRCSMCFQGKLRLPVDKDMMDWDVYRRIIDEVSPYTARVYLYWRGEPLMHPKLTEMIAYARAANLYVFISTNAVLLDTIKAQELIDAKLDYLLVGFDGATKKSYEAMRRGANFEQVLQNIRLLMDLKHAQRALLPHVALQFIISSINHQELSLFRELATNMGVDSTIEKILDLYTNFKNERIDIALNDLYVEGEWSKYERNASGHMSLHASIQNCDMPRRMVVRADGELNLCCYDMQGKYPIGSVRESSNLMNLWSSSAYATYRNKGQQRELGLCENCGAGLQR